MSLGGRSNQQTLSAQEITELLNRVARNDHKACVAFFNYFRPQVVMQVRKKVFADEYTIDGIVNTILYEAIAGIATYRQENGFAAFLSGITRNHCNNHIRSRYRGVQTSDHDDDALSAIPDEAPGPEDLLIQTQDADALNYCLEQLPEAQRECFLAHYRGGLSVGECAELFNIPANTVKSRNRLAREQLKPCIKKWFTGGRHD